MTDIEIFEKYELEWENSIIRNDNKYPWSEFLKDIPTDHLYRYVKQFNIMFDRNFQDDYVISMMNELSIRSDLKTEYKLEFLLSKGN